MANQEQKINLTVELTKKSDDELAQLRAQADGELQRIRAFKGAIQAEVDRRYKVPPPADHTIGVGA